MRELSVAEQRCQAVLAVISDGLSISQVASKFGVSRQTWHSWLAPYKEAGLEGLIDRSHAFDQRNRVAARRLDDEARAVFTGNYLREYITHDGAATVHSAQGVTADTTHAVSAKRSPGHCFTSRCHVAANPNRAYLYQRTVGEADHQHRDSDDPRVARRGSDREAAQLLRNVIGIATSARTTHDVSAATGRGLLPEPIGSLVDRRAKATERQGRNYSNCQEETGTAKSDNERSREQHASPTSGPNSRSSAQQLRATPYSDLAPTISSISGSSGADFGN
jgi:transposase-like protein